MEEELEEINQSFDLDPEEEEKEQFSSFVIVCNSEKQDDAIRDFFNLGVKTQSKRGKYESNIIDAEKIVSLIN